MATEKVNILLTSAGGLTGTFLIKHLTIKGKYRLIGCDMQPVIPMIDLLEQYYQVPSNTDCLYIKTIEKIILQERIDVVIPVSSFDIDLYSNGILYEQLKNKMLIMPYKRHEELHNKRKCYQYLNKLGILTPEVFGTPPYFPLVLKTEKGTGSKGTLKIEDEIAYSFWNNQWKNCFLSEYIPGDEFTVDCLFDRQGICVGYNNRKRIKMNGGGAVISQNVIENELDEIISILEKESRLIGPVNFQYKYKKDKICIFDFNTRLASGGLPLTVASGFDIPSKMIQIILEGKTDKWTISKDKENLTMYRYYEEVFK